MSTPINPAAHDFLIALGYIHTHHEAEFDDGDPENGPGTWGFPAWDEYTSDEDYVYISENGDTDLNQRDKEAEAFEATMMDEFTPDLAVTTNKAFKL